MTEPMFLHVESLEVASWSPGAKDEGVPCTQVHVITRIPEVDLTLVTRLKSKVACDELIAALIEHRDFVFGETQ